MITPPCTLYRVTSLADRSVRVQHALHRPSRQQTVRIDQWYMWAQAYLPEYTDLSKHTKFIECMPELGYQVETPVATNFAWEGPDWNEKAQHRMQKDLSKGGVERILEQQSSWRLLETQIWINAPFRIDIVDFLNNNTVLQTDVPYKGQIRT